MLMLLKIHCEGPLEKKVLQRKFSDLTIPSSVVSSKTYLYFNEITQKNQNLELQAVETGELQGRRK